MVHGSVFRAAIALGLALLWYCLGIQTSDAAALPKTARVAAVLDGDSIVLNSGEHVRYLGIDAPEVSHQGEPGDCYGEQARDANRNWVLNRTIEIEYDRERRDGYGRLLAYILLPDGTCVNAALLRGGFAWLLIPPAGINRLAEFHEAQREALHQRRGMWAACTFQEEASYLANRISLIFHRTDCPWAQKTRYRHRMTWTSRWQALEQGFRPCRQCKP
jgi:micrococcal nuclease